MRLLSVGVFVVSLAPTAQAGFVVIKDFDEWSAAVEGSTTLDFVFDTAQFLTDQYLGDGALFSGNEIALSIPSAFPEDDWGCFSGGQFGEGTIHVSFLQPTTALGAWFPGPLLVNLYSEGTLIYSSPNLETFGELHSFGAILSTQAFDEAVFYRIGNPGVFIDNLYFASQVPGPGAVACLGLGWFFVGGRGRRGQPTGG